MAEDDTSRLYHRIAPCSLFCVDATTIYFETVKNGGRVFYYAMVFGHPFNLPQPLPLAELITNEHDIDHIRRLVCELHSCKGRIYKASCKATPLAIMADFSLAIILAALFEYNSESYLQYLQRKFEILTGKANKKDIKHLFICTCTTHIMKNVKNLQLRVTQAIPQCNILQCLSLEG